MSQDPIRLLQDPALTAVLRNDLARATQSAPRTYDSHAGAARLKAAIAAGAAGAQVSSSSTAAASTAAAGKAVFGGGAKLWVVVMVGALGAGTALVRWQALKPAVAPSMSEVRPGPDPRPTAEMIAAAEPDRPMDMAEPDRAAVPAQPAMMAPRATSAEVPSSNSTPVRTRQRPGLARRHRVSSAKRTEHAAPTERRPKLAAAAELPVEDPDAFMRREIEELARLRRLLETSPRNALAVANAGQKEFASGMFSEERAAISIFALVRLGEMEAAHTRAGAFLDKYPRGSFSARVRQLTEPGHLPIDAE